MAKQTRGRKTPATIETLHPKIRETALRLADGDRSRIEVLSTTQAMVRASA